MICFLLPFILQLFSVSIFVLSVHQVERGHIVHETDLSSTGWVDPSWFSLICFSLHCLAFRSPISDARPEGWLFCQFSLFCGSLGKEGGDLGMRHPLGNFVSVLGAPPLCSALNVCLQLSLSWPLHMPTLPPALYHCPWSIETLHHCLTVLFGSTSVSLGCLQAVLRLKGFAAWHSLFKNERWWCQGSFIYLQQVKEVADLKPRLCFPKERLSQWLIHII